MADDEFYKDEIDSAESLKEDRQCFSSNISPPEQNTLLDDEPVIFKEDENIILDKFYHEFFEVLPDLLTKYKSDNNALAELCVFVPLYPICVSKETFLDIALRSAFEINESCMIKLFLKIHPIDMFSKNVFLLFLKRHFNELFPNDVVLLIISGLFKKMKTNLAVLVPYIQRIYEYFNGVDEESIPKEYYKFIMMTYSSFKSMLNPNDYFINKDIFTVNTYKLLLFMLSHKYFEFDGVQHLCHIIFGKDADNYKCKKLEGVIINYYFCNSDINTLESEASQEKNHQAYADLLSFLNENEGCAKSRLFEHFEKSVILNNLLEEYMDTSIDEE